MGKRESIETGICLQGLSLSRRIDSEYRTAEEEVEQVHGDRHRVGRELASNEPEVWLSTMNKRRHASPSRGSTAVRATCAAFQNPPKCMPGVSRQLVIVAPFTFNTTDLGNK